jgi:hypothetical protein
MLVIERYGGMWRDRRFDDWQGNLLLSCWDGKGDHLV